VTPVKYFFVRYRLIIYRVDTCNIEFEEELDGAGTAHPSGAPEFTPGF
jgi:hypothetical protein